MLHLCQGPTPALKQGHQDEHDALGPERGPAEEESRHNNNEHANDSADALAVSLFSVAVFPLARSSTSGHPVAVEGQSDPCVEEDDNS